MWESAARTYSEVMLHAPGICVNFELIQFYIRAKTASNHGMLINLQFWAEIMNLISASHANVRTNVYESSFVFN